MKKTLKEISDLLGVEVIGDSTAVITGIAAIQEAEKGDITFISDPKYLHFVKTTKASAIIASSEIKDSPLPLLKTKYPSRAFTKLIELFCPSKTTLSKGIHPTAIIGENVTLGQNVAIGPYVVIEDSVTIRDNCKIYSGVFIGYEAEIGEDSLIYSNVCIRENTSIGKRVIVHSSTVIGSDGFGFDTIEGQHYKIPQLGCVVIEDDVEIGANVTIDRARFDKTLVGKGTKIDNLVQIGHNVSTGENCIIVSQVGVSGSTKIGKSTILAGQAGIAGHLTIGDNVIVGAQGGVTRSIASGTFVSGYPARPHKHATKINAFVQRLPHLHEEVSQLKKRIERLESNRKLNKKRDHGKSKVNKKRSKGKR
ncbi:UDP-3-O-(3-hydroxymyristoyl)glucosamine N-acyltransferase [Thermoproteota archaeon]